VNFRNKVCVPLLDFQKISLFELILIVYSKKEEEITKFLQFLINSFGYELKLITCEYLVKYFSLRKSFLLHSSYINSFLGFLSIYFAL